MISPLTIVPAQAAPVVRLPGIRKISAQQAQQILSDNGMNVSIKQAAVIVDFLYTLAKMTTQ